MIVLGIVLLIVGYLLPISLLVTLGLILIVIGVVLEILGTIGHPLANRRHWW